MCAPCRTRTPADLYTTALLSNLSLYTVTAYARRVSRNADHAGRRVAPLRAAPRPAAPLARVAYTLLTHVPYAISYGNLLCTLNLRLHNWNLTHSYRRSDRDPRARTSDQCTDTTGPTQRRRAGVLRENTGALPLRACDRACVPPCATSTRRDAASGIDRRVPSRSTRGKGAVPSKMVALS